MLFAGICLITNDVRRLADFYKAVLAVPSDCDDEVHQEILTQGAALAILKADGVERGNHSMTMAFTVDDVDAEYVRLRGIGVDIFDAPTMRPWGAKNMGFCDPDGNRIVFRSFPRA